MFLYFLGFFLGWLVDFFFNTRANTADETSSGSEKAFVDVTNSFRADFILTAFFYTKDFLTNLFHIFLCMKGAIFWPSQSPVCH